MEFYKRTYQELVTDIGILDANEKVCYYRGLVTEWGGENIPCVAGGQLLNTYDTKNTIKSSLGANGLA